MRGLVEGDRSAGNAAYPNLFSPIRMAGLTVRNRVAMSAMSTHMPGPNGSVSPEQIAYYRERGLGGVGLVTVEYASVDSATGMARDWQLILDTPKNVAGHLFLVEAVKETGASICIQLHHAGRQTYPRNIGGRQPIAPSAVPSAYFGPKALARAMEAQEFEPLIEKFARSTRWALEAGYDAIELHAAHGYLLGQFLSPLTNLRDDEWGGDFERRLRFPTEVIKAVKAELGPNRPLIYRFSAEEFVEGGLTIADTEKIAPHLAAAGADVLHASTGVMDRMEVVIEPMSMPEGWRLPYAQRIRAAVDVPVITVGQLRQPAMAEAALRDGLADMVALGRPLLVDPFWPAKARAGRDLDIRPCTSCNWCTGPAGKHRGVGCAENPRAGNELDMPLEPVGAGRRAVVVGAGPGGMAAALLLAQSRFEVDLFEARGEVGGGLIVSATPPHKESLFLYLDYLKRRLDESPVKVRLNQRIGVEALLSMKPDVVIVASGTSAVELEVKGLDAPNVSHAFDLLLGDGAIPSGDGPVVVYGGGETGCETAEFLAARGVEVTLVSRSPAKDLARSAERSYRKQLRERLAVNPRIRLLENTHILEIAADQVIARTAGEDPVRLPAAAVVIAQGRKPAPLPLLELEAAGVRCSTIGDAVQVRRIGEAVAEAYRAVRALGRRLEPAQLAC